MRIGPRIGLTIGASIGGEPSGVAAVPTWHLVKTGGTNGGFDAEAYTAAIYTGTVSVEWALDSAADEIFIGLSADNPNPSYDAIDFCLGLSSTLMYRTENGVTTSLGATVAGDRWRVTRTIGTGAVTYYKNDVLVSTSSNTSVAALLVDSMFRFTGDSVSGVRVTTVAGAQPITWTLSGVTATEE